MVRDSSSECVIGDFHKGSHCNVVCSESRPKWFRQPMIRHILLEASAFSGRGENLDLGKTKISISESSEREGDFKRVVDKEELIWSQTGETKS